MNYLSLLLILLFSTTAISRTPEERKALFQTATSELKKSGIEQRAPKVGDQFPDLILGERKISEILKTGPLVLTFYRGGWCPYCVKQLKELNDALSTLKEVKAELIAVSPEKQLNVEKTKKKNNLKFTVLSDAKNALARRLGIVFKVDDQVVQEYKSLGIDLNESQGNDGSELPMPATFVVDPTGKVAYAFADADYTKRADLKQILEKLKALK